MKRHKIFKVKYPDLCLDFLSYRIVRKSKYSFFGDKEVTTLIHFNSNQLSLSYLRKLRLHSYKVYIKNDTFYNYIKFKLIKCLNLKN